MSDANAQLRASYDPATFAQGCRGKRGFSSKRLAAGHARVLARDTGDAFNVYRCKGCRYWHIGHRVPSYVRHRA